MAGAKQKKSLTNIYNKMTEKEARKYAEYLAEKIKNNFPDNVFQDDYLIDLLYESMINSRIK